MFLMPCFGQTCELNDNSLDLVQAVVDKSNTEVIGIYSSFSSKNRNEARVHAMNHRTSLAVRAAWIDYIRALSDNVVKLGAMDSYPSYGMDVRCFEELLV